MYAAAPAPVTTAELLMKRTMATKMATMSNELRTLGRIPPAIRSERKTLPLPLSAVDAIEFLPLKIVSCQEIMDVISATYPKERFHSIEQASSYGMNIGSSFLSTSALVLASVSVPVWASMDC